MSLTSFCSNVNKSLSKIKSNGLFILTAFFEIICAYILFAIANTFSRFWNTSHFKAPPPESHTKFKPVCLSADH
jgi:hypothetical protein